MRSSGLRGHGGKEEGEAGAWEVGPRRSRAILLPPNTAYRAVVTLQGNF